jgi:PKHD-type hydroxylase
VGRAIGGVLLAAKHGEDDGERTLLFDLDMAINQINQALPNHTGVVSLTNCYHNLLRRFAEV